MHFALNFVYFDAYFVTTAIAKPFQLREFWMEESRGDLLKLTINNYESYKSTFNKVKQTVFDSLTLSNTQVTQSLCHLLASLKIKELRFLNCVIKEDNAEQLAFSENVSMKAVFINCIVTDLFDGPEGQTEKINIGILKTEEEMAVFNPSLVALAEEDSEMDEELLKTIDIDVQGSIDFNVPPPKKITKNKVQPFDKQIRHSAMLSDMAHTYVKETGGQASKRTQGWIEGCMTIPPDIWFLKKMADKVDALVQDYLKMSHSRERYSKKQVRRQRIMLSAITKALESQIARTKDVCFNFYNSRTLL